MAFEKTNFDIFQIGYKDSFTKQINEEDVQKFSELTGDVNPVHMNEEYAGTTRFKKRIAHGVISAGIISALVGNKLMGVGSIYVSQELKFLAPVFIGDTLTASGEIVEKNEEKRRIKVKMEVHNQDGKLVTEGYGIVMHE
ncbi:MaoC family dehydratase [Serpentinicella alkaliphila]|uniref:3-hydroxybutyryl-CoA dehydratase n=1 Tax=Serpentinicella alkaliphila TaxID=1734049 RepID=A0A4V2T1U7_9FIRM|nr:MaoC family dehydratase [Serpentinicella alkaliphila]QUH26391.1 MaoC family dehydratase [Serpentinicella alkaliphila]TCP94933.1 3-hydroxybutyryl-CoA dehydratase [Serpentinicella alkaliphila]